MVACNIRLSGVIPVVGAINLWILWWTELERVGVPRIYGRKTSLYYFKVGLLVGFIVPSFHLFSWSKFRKYFFLIIMKGQNRNTSRKCTTICTYS